MSKVFRKATLLITSGPSHDLSRKHLFVVLNDPPGAPHQVVLVGICSIGTAPYDNTLTLDVGDHEFIRHPSYVDYRNTRLEFVSVIERRLAEGQFVSKLPVSDELFDRIVSGLRKSKFVKPWVRAEIFGAGIVRRT